MKCIIFVDTEIVLKTERIQDIGGVREDGSYFHSASVHDFTEFLKGADFICGHNILYYDMKYIGDAVRNAGIRNENIIDTLYLSPLLFPTKPYHALVKDDKLQKDSLNNPVNDSKTAQKLFYDEIAEFKKIDQPLQQILYLILKDSLEFRGFFHYIEYGITDRNVEELIYQEFGSKICIQSDLKKMIRNKPAELAYCLSLIRREESRSITPPWILKRYPDFSNTMFLLRGKPCSDRQCGYCTSKWDIYISLKKHFNYDSYRKYGGESLQERAVFREPLTGNLYWLFFLPEEESR